MKKFISLCAMLITTFMFSIVSAEVDEQNLVNDMFAHPKNYFYASAGATSTGDSIYAIKSSVSVKKYAPPQYIISIKTLQYFPIYQPARSKPSVNLQGEKTFHYDYKNKKILGEGYEGKLYELDLNKANKYGMFERSASKEIFLAELAFYLAYNQSFFDKPVSDLLVKYINGNGVFFNPNE